MGYHPKPIDELIEPLGSTHQPIDDHDLPSDKINIDPENKSFLVETSLPTPICQGLC